MSVDYFPWKSRSRALVVGDLMLDIYVSGDAHRLSPEAPVPVVMRTGRSAVPGGAANAAANLRALGDHVTLIGVVGPDREGEELTASLTAAGMNTDGVLTISGPTTTKQRVVAGGQQLVRLDVEAQKPLAADVLESCLEHCRARVSSVDVVLISDYDKGLCTEHFCREVISLAAEHSLPVVVDPKGRDFAKYVGATLLTPNVGELRQATEKSDGLSVDQMAAGHLGRHDSILVTRSADGMSLYRADMPPLHMPTEAHTVFDVTGAGDTVASVTGALLARRVDLETACDFANACAGIVVGRAGTTAVTREDVVETWIDRYDAGQRVPSMLDSQRTGSS